MFNSMNARNLFAIKKKENSRWRSPYVNKVHNSLLEFVGNTPLIKLNNIPRDHGLSCEIYAKCEFMNPAGSSKDRIGLAMVQDAESGGNISENTHFVEPTSGNTGISVAYNAALINKKCTIVMGEKNSSEKLNTMLVLGSDVIQTKKSPTEIAQEIIDANPDSVVKLNQFENHVNPRIHYETTGIEILDALCNVDMFVAGVGTGGTITGVGYRIKENCPNCIVIAAEPEGSTMFNEQGKNHSFLVEGIGGSSVPIVLDKSIVDAYEVINDEESFLIARELIKKEGILCGGSSGTAMAAAIKVARKRKLGAGQRVVVILSDGIRNYMTKFVHNQWMEAHLFMDPPEHTMSWWKHPITNLNLNLKYPIVEKSSTCDEALKQMKSQNIAIVVNEIGWFVGTFTKDSIRHKATNPPKLPNLKSEELDFSDPVTDHLVKDCYTLAKNGKKGLPTIGLLSRMLDITTFVVIGVKFDDANGNHFLPESVATADNVLDYIFTHR